MVRGQLSGTGLNGHLLRQSFFFLLLCCIFQASSPPVSGLCYHLTAGILGLQMHGNMSSFACGVRDGTWVNRLAWIVLLAAEPSPQPPPWSPHLLLYSDGIKILP